ncbi:predicted protein [Nematostella vectensis]|uniref:RNA polymerase sigma-54 factor n=1 Tax=Nematostella vectensis TaxID=45351 RepID=A7TBU8_NEMVE|nr:predicted protein [Nematostella vectensis]|eukprot:XP_001618605.1 hypothetical protein NEMVEDRAFT_v1g224973 [Nematostella vectensis]
MKYMKFSYTEANLLPENHEVNLQYNQFLDIFGEEGNLIILAVNDSTIFTPKKFNAWNQLTEKFKALKEVDFSVSVADVQKLKADRKNRKFVLEPLLKDEISTQKQISEVKKQLFEKLPFYENLLYNKKTQTIQTAIYINKEIVNTPIRKDFIFEKLIPTIKAFEKEHNIKVRVSENSFDHFVKKHYKKLMEKFAISEEELKEVIQEISKLNPKPGSSYAGNNKVAEQIVPDFNIKIIDGNLDLTLNARNAPELHISKEYNNMLKGYQESKEKSKSQKDAVLFIKQKLDAAKWFIDAIRQRQQTLLITMNAIMHYQYDYFLTGDERKLKPMILKDIADQIGMDISTVSRVANSKYVATPYGTKLIKDFFSESMKNDQGEDVSTKEIKKILETVISEEDKRKPLTDDKLSAV